LHFFPISLDINIRVVYIIGVMRDITPTKRKGETMRPSRVATINHNDGSGRRVRIELIKTESGYNWQSADGEDAGLPISDTIAEAEADAIAAWGADIWDLRAKWIN
jgi:hypothetical protein